MLRDLPGRVPGRIPALGPDDSDPRPRATQRGLGDSPFLLRPGDRVSFDQVDEDELLEAWRKVEAGEYTYEIEDSPFDVGAYLDWLPKVADEASERRKTAEEAWASTPVP